MPYQNLQTMEIPEEYTVTHTDEPFLLYDSGIDSPARILIFSTETNLKALTTTGHWFADGTFKTAPELFYQIYTIHTLVAMCLCTSTKQDRANLLRDVPAATHSETHTKP